jgi:zinc protease
LSYLETQRNVVMEERRSRYDNQPYGTMMENLFSRAYSAQPYKWSTIGSMTDIRNASLEDVRNFHVQFYQPSNASLCVAGHIDRDEVRRIVGRYFGEIQNRQEPIGRNFPLEAPQSAQIRDVVYDSVPLPAVIIGFHIPDMNAEEFPALNLLSHILSLGESSRLYRSMVYEQCVAQSVATYAFDLELPGLFLFRAIAQQGAAPEKIEELFWQEVSRLGRSGIGADELEKAKNKQETMFIHDLVSMQSRADLLNSFHVLAKDTGRINSELRRMRRVTVGDIQNGVCNYLRPENSTLLYYLPRRGENSL